MIMGEHMLERLLVTSAIGCALLASACSDDVKTVGDNKGASNQTEYGVSDITGTWDLTASVSETGETITGTLEIARQIFRLEIAGVAIDYSTVPEQGLWVDTGNGGTYYGVTHDGGESLGFPPEESALDLGVIPADIAGGWTALTERSIEDRQLRAIVQRHLVILSSTPGANGGKAGTLEVERFEPARSIFGDLGGSWTIGTRYDLTGGCSASLRDTTVNAGCNGTGPRSDGSMTFTMRDGLGTGTTSGGLEISAVRR